MQQLLGWGCWSSVRFVDQRLGQFVRADLSRRPWMSPFASGSLLVGVSPFRLAHSTLRFAGYEDRLVWGIPRGTLDPPGNVGNNFSSSTRGMAWSMRTSLGQGCGTTVLCGGFCTVDWKASEEVLHSEGQVAVSGGMRELPNLGLPGYFFMHDVFVRSGHKRCQNGGLRDSARGAEPRGHETKGRKT